MAQPSVLNKGIRKLKRQAISVRRWGAFAHALRRSLRRPITVEDSRRIIRQRLADREVNFIRMVERNIYGHPRSPYLSLLNRAGCDLADLVAVVRSKGVEGTLHTLRDSGVYVTFEEFKGREPIVRGDLVIDIHPDDFNNPFIRNYYDAQTGGTTGPPSRIPIDLAHLAAQAPNELLSYDAHGLSSLPAAMWWPDFGGFGLIVALRGAHYRWPLRRWFSPPRTGAARTEADDRLNRWVIALARLSGVSIPRPEPIALEDAERIARWAVRMLARGQPCVIRSTVSLCARVALAARRAQLDLTGLTFVGGAEPPTPAKVRHITASGARWVPYYFFAEVGCVGYGCTNAVDENDLHFMSDSLALIPYPRRVPGSDLVVEAFNLTTLLGTAGKVLLNVESDDYGVIEERHCGCPLEQEGLTTHIREVRSFRKLTGEGMTLVGSDMLRILEDVLPARFGGTTLDYQLWEEEDAEGFTRLVLAISPRLGMLDERMVVETVLANLRNYPPVMWRQANTLRVRRVEPVWTARGKLMPLHMDRQKPSGHVYRNDEGARAAPTE